MAKKKHADQEGEAPAQEAVDVHELLADGVALVGAIHHQNDSTREWVRKAKVVLDSEPEGDQD